MVHFVVQNLLQEPDAYEIPATVYDFVASLCLRSLCLPVHVWLLLPSAWPVQMKWHWCL